MNMIADTRSTLTRGFEQFDIRDHVDKLARYKGGKYCCPVCGGNNLSISKKDGAYKCFNDCENKDIREAIAPWADRQQSQPEPQRKAARPKQTRHWIYNDIEGNPCIRVNRTDDGVGKKRIWQEFWAKGVWTTKAPDSDKTKLKAAVTIYRHPEVMAAIAEGRQIFWVEGEPCADLLWSMGLAATTSIGGSAAYKSNGDYSQVLKGARLVICPDRDANGLKYAEAVGQDYPESQWLYAIPESPAWEKLPQAGGLDIADWVTDYKITTDAIIAAIEPGQRAKAAPIAPLLDGAIVAPHQTPWVEPIVSNYTIGVIENRGTRKEPDPVFAARLACDLRVTKEFKSSDGGGLELEVSRWSEGRLKVDSVLIDSLDCIKPEQFTAALARGLGTHIACTIKPAELNALLENRKQDYYRAGGKSYRLADRFGEQSDGYRVFEDCQFTPTGEPCTEAESGWIFNPRLGHEDDLNSPVILPENPEALPGLVAAAKAFYHPEALGYALCEIGYGAATLHRNSVIGVYDEFAQSTIDGEAGCGKTKAAKMAAAIAGMHKREFVMGVDTTASAAAERLKLYSGLPVVYDDPIPLGGDAKDIKAAKKTVNATLARLFNLSARSKRGGGQAANTNVIVTSNAGANGAAAALDERIIIKNYPNHPVNLLNGEGDRLDRAMDAASGGYGALLRIKFDRDKIDSYVVALIKHLPNAHVRQARSLAIQCYFTEEFCKVAGVTDFDAFAFTRDVLCPQADATCTNKPNLTDFLERLDNLRTAGLIGKWNATTVTRDGRSYLAVKHADVWEILQKQQSANLPNYGLSALKSQIADQGGFSDHKQRAKFVPTMLAWKDYLSAETQFNIINGEDSAASRPIPPTRSLSCGCWLIPLNAVGDALGRPWDDDYSSEGDSIEDVAPTLTVQPEATIAPTALDLEVGDTIVITEQAYDNLPKGHHATVKATHMSEPTDAEPVPKPFLTVNDSDGKTHSIWLEHVRPASENDRLGAWEVAA
jgi:hypothetical protein